MHTYTGNPNAFHASVTLPDNGDPPLAEVLNPPPEALMDNCANLNARADSDRAFLESMPALNWTVEVADEINRQLRCAFDTLNRRWISVGPYNALDAWLSIAGSNTWTSQNGAIAGVLTGGTAIDVAADQAGHTIVAFDGTAAKLAVLTGTTWVASTVSADDKGSAGIAFDPASGLWCHVYRAGAEWSAGARVYTSPDRVTWTARTAPWAGNVGPMAIVSLYGCGGATPNRLVWLAQTGKHDTHYTTHDVWSYATSDDGGATWTARGTFDGGLDAAEWADERALSVDSDNGDIYFTTRASAATATKIVRSTDAGVTFATWRSVPTYIGRVAAKAGLVVGVSHVDGVSNVCRKGEIIYAPPSDGVFRASGARLVHYDADSPAVVGVGNGGFYALGAQGTVWRGLRYGRPLQTLA